MLMLNVACCMCSPQDQGPISPPS